jgi:hypothetical protein
MPDGFTVVEVVVVGFTVVEVVVVGFTVVGGTVTTGFTVVVVTFGVVTGTRAGATTVVVGAAVVDVVVVGFTVVVVVVGATVVVVTGTRGARGTSATLLRRLRELPIIAVIQQCDSHDGGKGTTAKLRPFGSGNTLVRSIKMIDSAVDWVSVSSSAQTRRLRAHSMRYVSATRLSSQDAMSTVLPRTTP